MNATDIPYHFKAIKRRYQILRGVEVLLWIFAVSLFTFYVARILIQPVQVAAGIALTFAVLTFAITSRQIKLFTIKEDELALYLNRRYPFLQESVDLLLKDDEELSALQQLQKARTTQRLEEIYPTIKLPHGIVRAAAVLALSAAASFFLTSFIGPIDSAIAETPTSIQEVRKENLHPSIKSCSITISPPVYTSLSATTSPYLNLLIPEGSSVQWKINFEGETSGEKIIFSTKDSIALSPYAGGYIVEKNFSASGFYLLQWVDNEGRLQSSDYYKIEVRKDLAPVITVENLNQFQELSAKDILKIDFKTNLADDYGVNGARIIATVSKGSGEAIKFREEKLSFDVPARISGKNIRASKSLDLVKLGLEPGDELYFYIEAEDNKMPLPNRSRTETYFISLLDTASMLTSVDAGLGVDLMPEYFRSQRQIIIDSEKLLREKKQIAKQNFNDRSNELAHDQKVLRLRYGEFLGEEFETSIGPQSAISEGEDEDIQQRFGHSHDTDNEHNLVEEKQSDHQTHTDHNKPGASQKSDPLKEFVHAHDDDEEATFFIQSIRAKLKAAVTIMWDAELYLRLYEPEKSLPYQYKALRLLKEISQDSRIYVHRTGFDPPPLKEEKRLTADLEEIKSSVSDVQTRKTNAYPSIREALPMLEKLLSDGSARITSDQKILLTKAGQEVAEVELKNPGQYLGTLSQLKKITQNELRDETLTLALFQVRASFWKILPMETQNPQTRSGVTHDLDRQFLESLEHRSRQNN